MKNKLYLIACSILYTLNMTAQTFRPKTGAEVNAQVTAEASPWVDTINIIMGIVIFGGAIYVITGLLAKKERPISIIIIWFLTILVWGIANWAIS